MRSSLDKCWVLGRGKSLARLFRWPWVARQEPVYLVNNMDEEIGPRGCGRCITHVTGRKGATVMRSKTYKRLGIKRVVVNAKDREHICNIKRYRGCDVEIESRPMYMDGRGYKSGDWKRILKGKSGGVTSDNGQCWPTTGLFAIELALVETSPKEMRLFGFDFYTQDYLIKPNRKYQTQKNPKVKMMFVHMQKLVNEFKDTQF